MGFKCMAKLFLERVRSKKSSLSTSYQQQASNSNSNQGQRPQQHRQGQTSSMMVPCDEYMPKDQVLKDVEDGKLIRGILRINAKIYTDSFITDPAGGSDFYIDNVRDRNRALNSDEVAIMVKQKREWKVIPECSLLVERFIHQMRQANAAQNDSSVIPASETGEIRTEDQKQDEVIGKSDQETVEGELSADAASSVSKSPTKGGRNDRRDTISSICGDNSVLTDEMVNRIPDEYFQRTAKVICLLNRRHTMKAAGLLRKMPDNSPHYALFSPMDSRIPRLMIPMKQCPSDFYDRPMDYEKSLFVAKIIEIPADKKFARGELGENLGDADTLEAQSKAILMENDIRDEEFSEEVIKCLPLDKEKWEIPTEEYEKRLDLRQSCIFTIDPATARDLDDALSCEPLENGHYRVGVHIADVSYFVSEKSVLDTEASTRTTSVYLVERVIPMLPRLLCDRLCSLNPNEDRLTFSVIWTLDENGQILDEHFTRSIIRSCVKLSYEHAQVSIQSGVSHSLSTMRLLLKDFIDHPDKDFKAEELPPICNNYSVDDIKQKVLHLYKISKCLRTKRAGALTLNQPKLQYKIQPNTKMPLSFSIYQQKDSNRLVEEFMLLANIQVARKLCSDKNIQEKAILRRHPAPNPTTMQSTSKQLKAAGGAFDGISSTSIADFLQFIDDESKKALYIHLLAKSMQLAIYCCASCVKNEDYRHYALNVEYYTHFTSPIRRYPDILVHRQLGAILGYNESLHQHPRTLEQLAQQCNEKRVNAKTCSEKSAELYLAVLVREYGTLQDEALIITVKDESLDVLLFRIGVPLRIGINNLPLDHPRTNFRKIENTPYNELTIYWKSTDRPEAIKQVLRPFELVNIDITSDFDKNSKKLKLSAVLRHVNAEKLTTLANLCSITTPANSPPNQIIQRMDFDPYAEY
ncbi:unnamed protein product [Didymodactylos carnosus]|uniref:RNB domain-containing protein n=1 Tax=Didymodactylos carnosus TaxID=1234261 RepID=A0A813YFS9_9BILA|nr:unnamed protein product [Didymodactylos carnosus]CAF3669295.1 unnamed protein product [Didymodactylos carnosus]